MLKLIPGTAFITPIKPLIAFIGEFKTFSIKDNIPFTAALNAPPKVSPTFCPIFLNLVFILSHIPPKNSPTPLNTDCIF